MDPRVAASLFPAAPWVPVEDVARRLAPRKQAAS